MNEGCDAEAVILYSSGIKRYVIAMMIKPKTREPEVVRVKIHPTQSYLRMAHYLLFIYIGALIISCVLLYIVSTHFDPALQDGSHFFYAFAGNTLVMLYSFIMYWNLNLFTSTGGHWSQWQKKRKRAISGNAHFLSDLQPPPNPYTLMLPLTIRRRPEISFYQLLAPVIIALLVNALVITLSIVFKSSYSRMYMAEYAIFFLLGISIIIWLDRQKARETLVVTEDGLWQSRFSFSEWSWHWHHLSWQDARLLAIDATTLLQKYPTDFELAGEHEVIYWRWQRTHKGRGQSFSPAVSDDEYDQILFNLLSLIKARTGLPLYDLRKRV